MTAAWPALLLLAQVQALAPMDGQEQFASRVRELCPAEQGSGYPSLIRQENRLADSAVGRRAAPEVWSSLACARALLAASGAVAREGTLMPVGTSWSRGAIDALKRAIEVGPADQRVSGLLAAFALSPRERILDLEAFLLEDFAEAVYRSVQGGVNSAPVFRACTRMLIAVGDIASARDCSHRAMSSGFDSTWHWLRLARTSLAQGDSIEGVASLERAAMAANDSAAMNEFLFPFFVKADWRRWIGTAPIQRLAWIDDSLFPVTPTDTEPPSLADLVARQFQAMPGGTLSLRWYCMEEFIEECTQVQPRGETLIWTAARFHQLWDSVTDRPMALVTFGFRVGSLDAPRNGASRLAEVDVDLRTWDEGARRWSDTAFARGLRFPVSTPGAAFATGLAVIPASAGVTSWTLQVRQSDTRRGQAFDDRHPPLDSGPLALSDLLLGGDNQGLPWEHDGRRLFVAPLGRLKRLEPVQLFYQLRSDRERPELKMTLLLHRVVDNVAERDPALELSFDQTAGPGVTDRTLALDLTRLEVGSYLLAVVVRDPVDGSLVRRETTLHVD